MNRTVLLAVLIALALIGLADSLYLSQSAMTDTPLVCDIQGLDDCNTVAESPYSKLLGVPLAVYGLGFYGAILALGIFLYFRPSRLGALALVAGAVLGALSSAYFLYLQVAVIQAFCVYCIASAIISFILAALALGFWKRLVPTPPVVLP